MKLKAVYNAVIVKPVELDEEHYGNIIVPDLGSEKNKMGEIISVGPGNNMPGVGFVETLFKEGDRVVLPTMGFTRFDYESQEYWIGPENQVLAKINE